MSYLRTLDSFFLWVHSNKCFCYLFYCTSFFLSVFIHIYHLKLAASHGMLTIQQRLCTAALSAIVTNTGLFLQDLSNRFIMAEVFKNKNNNNKKTPRAHIQAQKRHCFKSSQDFQEVPALGLFIKPLF